MPTETKIGKAVLKIAGLITSITVIIGSIGWVYNEYQERKSIREKQLDELIDQRIKNHGNEILIEINSKTELFESVVDSLQNKIDYLMENDRKFAIGYRSDGENLYYRDMYKVDHQVYWDSDLSKYYYIQDGRAVYL